jgi:hypothetical protein
MSKPYRRQVNPIRDTEAAPHNRPGAGFEAVVPNPKLKLMDQVREVMRLRHYSIRTERCYCDWIRRYIKFHKMQRRASLDGGESKIEAFLSDLVHGSNGVRGSLPRS